MDRTIWTYDQYKEDINTFEISECEAIFSHSEGSNSVKLVDLLSDAVFQGYVVVEVDGFQVQSRLDRERIFRPMTKMERDIIYSIITFIFL